MVEGILTFKETLDNALAVLEKFDRFNHEPVFFEEKNCYCFSDAVGKQALVSFERTLFEDINPDDPSGIHILTLERNQSDFLESIESYLREQGIEVFDVEYI